MSQWEYVVKEARIFHFGDDPENFASGGGSTLPEEKQRLKNSFDEGMIAELSEVGQSLQAYLDELGEAGWEVYQIERLNIKKTSWLTKHSVVNYRFFAKRRRSE